MPGMERLNAEQQKAVKELENRVRSKLTSSSLDEDDSLFYRFLKARDFDVDKAEKMLIKHIDWRKVYQVDTILETFKPKEVFLKYIEPNLLGFDKEGNVVRYAASGRLNNAEIIKCFTMHDYMKHWIWFAEKNFALSKQQKKKTGKMAHLSFILDLDQLEFANATSKLSTDIFRRFVTVIQDNYPERLASTYVINAPTYFVITYSIVKAVMSNAMLQKIHVFGYSGWKEKLLEVMDADVLPAFLGGKRTDPDGDPYCRSFINIPGKIPETFHLSEAERFFKDPTEVTRFVIQPLEKKHLFVQVKDAGSLIRWKFLVRNKSIAFGLYFEESQKVIKEIIPMHEYDTSDGTEQNFYKCLTKGKFVIIFDNPSRFTSKEIQYIVSVEKLEI